MLGKQAGGQRGPRESGPGSVGVPWLRWDLHPVTQTQTPLHMFVDSQGPGTSTAPQAPGPCVWSLHTPSRCVRATGTTQVIGVLAKRP